MCHFITLGIEPQFANDVPSFVPRGLALLPVDQPKLQAHFGKQNALHLLISGGCSCGLFTPARNAADIEQAAAAAAAREGRRRAQYAKRGWSTARIERALRQHKEHAGHGGATSPPGYAAEVCQFVSAIVSVAGAVALLVHFYDEAIETADFDVLIGPTIATDLLCSGEFPFQTEQLIRVADAR